MKKINSVNFGSKGYFTVSVLNAAGEVQANKIVGPTANVVTYAGAFWALIDQGLFGSYQCRVGTGTVERTRSSTALGVDFGALSGGSGGTVRSGNEVDNLDGTSTLTLTRTMEFGLGTTAGTFSELAVFSGAQMIAGQLIKDAGGSPTTVTVLADEQLVVSYVIEWTVPNTSVLVGTGTVTDAATNNYNYEVWAQPYFNEYANIGNSNTDYRYNDGATTIDEIGFKAADGVTELADSGDIGNGFGGRYSHNGSGVVTVTSAPYVFSPASLTFTNLVFMTFFCFNSNTANQSTVTNTATALAVSNSFNGITYVVKFLTPVTKTSSDSFAVDITATINI
jgi:hypothetical protein